VLSFSYTRRLYVRLACGRQRFRILDEPPLLHAQQPCDFQSNNTTTKRLDIMVPRLARSHSSFHHQLRRTGSGQWHDLASLLPPGSKWALQGWRSVACRRSCCTWLSLLMSYHGTAALNLQRAIPGFTAVGCVGS
jgi:hypothetical protein